MSNKNLMSTKTIIEIIKILNKKTYINAILIQLPIPYKIEKEKIYSYIKTKKDIDFLNPKTFGTYIMNNNKNIIPCTAQAIDFFFKLAKIKTKGLKACIIGFSNIVGKPISYLLKFKVIKQKIIHKNKNTYKYSL